MLIAHRSSALKKMLEYSNFCNKLKVNVANCIDHMRLLKKIGVLYLYFSSDTFNKSHKRWVLIWFFFIFCDSNVNLNGIASIPAHWGREMWDVGLFIRLSYEIKIM